MIGVPLTAEQIDRIRELRDDGYSQVEVARRVGVGRRTVDRHAPGRRGMVWNEPLRVAFLRSGISAADVARRLGWSASRGSADTARVRRALGILPDIQRTGRRSFRTRMDFETAERIGEIVGVASWELEDAP